MTKHTQKIREWFKSLFKKPYLNLGYVAELKKRGIKIYSPTLDYSDYLAGGSTGLSVVMLIYLLKWVGGVFGAGV